MDKSKSCFIPERDKSVLGEQPVCQSNNKSPICKQCENSSTYVKQSNTWDWMRERMTEGSKQ